MKMVHEDYSGRFILQATLHVRAVIVTALWKQAERLYFSTCLDHNLDNMRNKSENTYNIAWTFKTNIFLETPYPSLPTLPFLTHTRLQKSSIPRFEAETAPEIHSWRGLFPLYVEIGALLCPWANNCIVWLILGTYTQWRVNKWSSFDAHNVPLQRKGCSIHENIHKKGLSKEVLFFGYVRFAQQYGSLYQVSVTDDSAYNQITCNILTTLIRPYSWR